jgi:hypothetical protein
MTNFIHYLWGFFFHSWQETIEFFLEKRIPGGLGFSIAGGYDDPTMVCLHGDFVVFDLLVQVVESIIAQHWHLKCCTFS